MKTKAGKSKARRVSKQRFHIVEFKNPSGEKAFRVAGYKADGSRVRENYKTNEEAVARKTELDIEAANIHTTTATRLKATRLTDEQIQDAERAVAKLSKFADKTLLEVAEYFEANYREPVRQKLIEAAVEKFIGEREKQNRRPDTLRNLRGRLGMLSRLYGKKNVADLTLADCQDFVFRPDSSPRNQINDRLAASNFLNWCVRQEFTTINFMASLEQPGVDSQEPSVLTLADCRNLLAAGRDYKDGHVLPYIVLSLFGGLRPTEIARVNWDRIDLKDGTVTLDGSMAKTRQRRIVKLSENAQAWLRPFALKKPQLKPASFSRHFRRVAKAAGFGNEQLEKAKEAARKRTIPKPVVALPRAKNLRPWVQDYMRHTAISMHLAFHKHEGETASWAGNSPNVIHQHYKGLIKEADAKEFWTITPEAVKSAIVQFPTKIAA